MRAQNSASGDARNLSTGSVESTACLAMLMDVNGNKKPNKIGKDILNIGVTLSSGGGSLDCVDVGSTGLCIATTDAAISPVDCTAGDADFKYCNGETTYSQDYAAGAVKACEELGGRLPSLSEFQTLYDYILEDFGARSAEYSIEKFTQYWVAEFGDAARTYNDAAYQEPPKGREESVVRARCVQ